MCIISKKTIAFWTQVEGMRGEVSLCHPSNYNHDASVCPMNPFGHMVTVGLQWQSVRLE